jgi:zinc transport system substrate-binding protein
MAAVAGIAVAGPAGCGGSGDGGSGRVNVVASFYPLQFVAERVGGDLVRVQNLVKPGAEPHDLELQPSQVAAILDADLVLYLGGFQPAVDDVAGQQPAARTLDVSGVAGLDPAAAGLVAGSGPAAKDPHVWLDPTRLTVIATAIATRLAEIDPEHAGDYQAGATTVGDELTTLDEEYARGLATCARRDIVTSHAAFGYLASRYDLRQIAVTGLSPDEEASPARLAEVAQTARAAGATTIFFETLVSNRVAQTVAEEVGAKAAVLDPIEGLEPGSSDDYFSIMRSNLTTLRSALDCT